MTDIHPQPTTEDVSAPSCVLYLGIGGVLQPSRSTYTSVHGHDPFEDGHQPYQCAPLLEELLQDWCEVRIVLTSTRPWAHGLDVVLAALGPALASRVIGYTFKDLTERAKVGERFPRCISEMDYWRLSKSQLVERHVRWLRPARWMAIDDEGFGWSDHELACHVVLTPPLEGLSNQESRAKVHGILVHQFGPPTEAPGLPGPTEEMLFDPDHARRFTIAAAAQAFASMAHRTRVLLLGLEGTIFAHLNGVLTVRPYAFSFLESCLELFERLVVMPGDVDRFRATAKELSRRGAVPVWFSDLDCIAWSGGAKDLWRLGVFALEEALAVDADRGQIVQGQEARWVEVSAFDCSPGDYELLAVYERLEATVVGTREVGQP